MLLVLNILSDYVRRNRIPNTTDKIPVAPYLARPHLFPHLREPLEQFPGRYALQHLYQLRRRVPRWRSNEHMYVILHHLHGIDPEPIFLRYLLDYLLHVHRHFPPQYLRSVLRYPHQMILQVVNRMAALPEFHSIFLPPIHHPGKFTRFASRRTAFLPTASCRVSSRPFNDLVDGAEDEGFVFKKKEEQKPGPVDFIAFVTW